MCGAPVHSHVWVGLHGRDGSGHKVGVVGQGEGIIIASAFPGTSSSVAIVCQGESLCVRGRGESSEVEWLTTR